MSKKNKSKLLNILFVIVIISSATILSIIMIEKKASNGILKDISISFNKLFVIPFTSKEQEIQTESYLIQKNLNDSLTAEVKELKELLNLNSTLSEYEIENATVLSRNKSYWLNTLTIDKGKDDDIKKNMVVINSEGMIGVVSKVSKNSSEVKLITTNDINTKISVSIRINEVDNYGILNGYNSKDNLIKIAQLDKNIPVKEGDIVTTSGLSEYIPRGIYIGKVKKIESDKYNLSKIIYVESEQNFNNIHYVTVLKELK